MSGEVPQRQFGTKTSRVRYRVPAMGLARPPPVPRVWLAFSHSIQKLLNLANRNEDAIEEIAAVREQLLAFNQLMLKLNEMDIDLDEILNGTEYQEVSSQDDNQSHDQEEEQHEETEPKKKRKKTHHN